MIWKLAKTVWVGGLTSLILFHANADEIQDVYQASRTAEITRTVEQKDAARRALENARKRILEESGTPSAQAEELEPENLVGEINALESLKAKLKRELDSLREPVPAAEPAVVSAPAEKVVAAPQNSPKAIPQAQAVGSTTSAVGQEDWDEFKSDISRQVNEWREKDLKQQLGQRAAIQKDQAALEKSFTAMLARVDEKLVSLKAESPDPKAISTEVSKAVDSATKGMSADLQGQLASVQASIDELNAKQPEAIDTEKLEAKLLDELRGELEKSQKATEGRDAQTAKALLALRGDLEKSAALSEEVASLKEQVASTSKGMSDLQGESATSKGDQAELVNYRKSLKDDIQVLRTELRDQLQSEIGALAKSIDSEKTARTEAMNKQSLQIASLEKSLSKQIAESLGTIKPAAETEAVIAALRDENTQLKTTWENLRTSLDARLVALEQAPAATGATEGEADLSAFQTSVENQLTAFKAGEAEARAKDMKKIEFALNQYIADVDNRLAALSSSRAVVVAAPVIAIEEEPVAAVEEVPVVVVEEKVVVQAPAQAVEDVQPEDVISTEVIEVASADPVEVVEPMKEAEVPAGDAPSGDDELVAAPVTAVEELSPVAEEQRVKLEDLRGKLKKSLQDHQEKVRGERAELEAARQQHEEKRQTDRKRALRQKMLANPEATGQEDRLDEETVEVAEQDVAVVGDEVAEVVSEDVAAPAEEQPVEEDAPVEPILVRDEKPAKKSFFGWFRRGAKENTTDEEIPIDVAADSAKIETDGVEVVAVDEVVEEPAAKAAEPVAKVEEAIAKVEEPVAKVEEAVAKVEEAVAKVEEAVAKVEEPVAKVEEPVAKAEAPVASVEESAPMEPASEVVEAENVEVEETPASPKAKKGLFGWFGKKRNAVDNDVDVVVEDVAEEIAEDDQTINGRDAEPVRNGKEGDLVRGIRGSIDTQIAALNGEMDQHPVFDLDEVAVVPAAGPKAVQTTNGSWKYDGGFANGKMNGAGSLTYPDGRVYTGEWNNGIRQGQGTLVHPDGWTFVGEWGEGLLNGEGSLTYADGWSYSGTWKKGQMNGAGVLKHPEGWTYSGEWKKGKMQGDGVLSYEDGWAYEGAWKNGKRTRQGTLTHPDGWTYTGEWDAGRRSGKGILTFADGWTYNGDWKDGTMNGSGSLQHPDGWAYEGEWKNGEMAGDGKIRIQN